MSLTRTDLESKFLQRIITDSAIGIYVLTEAELEASIESMLQKQPADSDIWVFAYGSLIWNPVFHFIDRQVGTIHGWHRQFCLWTPLGRGTPDNPGLVLGLERGGSCRGVAYRIAAAQARSELLLVWRREMVVGSYLPRWVKVTNGKETVEAIAFTINREHQAYTGKVPLSVITHQIATAEGSLGSCTDYLLQTIDGLASEGIHDRYLITLRDRVLEMKQTNVKGQHPELAAYYSLGLEVGDG
jgi:glutathione-specific gamma-glutamylcyclotransferase